MLGKKKGGGNYTLGHTCWNTNTAFPAPLSVGLQDGIDTELFNNLGRGEGGGVKEHNRRCSGKMSQLICLGV